MKKRTMAESLGAVHTHTHTHNIFIKKQKKHKFICFIKVVYKRWMRSVSFCNFIN